MPNRLARETSPYLLQHQDNPVDWHPWSDEAWQLAREQDKPVLISIGYAACHWCHVMERESFENHDIAQLQNELVVSIKVDREERPDIDEIYMDAQQMLHGHGGWPLNVFCTPDRKPFFGGTYFPPQARTGMPGWPDVLRGVDTAWRQKRPQVEAQANQLARNLDLSSNLIADFDHDQPEPPADIRQRAANHLLQNADRTHGGFGAAPKFPQPFYLRLLLQHALDHNAPNRDDAQRHLALSLTHMAHGGIYDHLAGGFHRYAVDQTWLVPHFEKMLYDNAILIPLYLDAWRLDHNPLFQRIARETADYLLRDLQTPHGAFYASTDADSEGEEGKYFVWTRQQLFELLEHPDAEIACRHWGVDIAGNFEGKSILHNALSIEDTARWADTTPDHVHDTINRARQTLLQHRDQRVPPATDTKIIAAWNGLAIDALAQAGAVLNHPPFTDAAERAAQFILDHMRDRDGRLLRIHAGGRPSVPAFLEDYAALADGLLSLYETTADERWFRHAQHLADDMCQRFWDHEHGAFFTVANDGERLIAQRKPNQDGATPSGNALAAKLLARLYALTADGQHADRIADMQRAFAPFLQQAPTMQGLFVASIDWLADHRAIALVGHPDDPQLNAMRRQHWTSPPNAAVLMQRLPDHPSDIPQLADKPAVDAQPTAYVCRGFACSPPVHTSDDLRNTLNQPLPA